MPRHARLHLHMGAHVNTLRLAALLLVSSGSLHAQWEEQSSGVTASLWDVRLLDADTVIVVGDSGIILRTTNAGLTWERQQSPTTFPLLSLSFPDSKHGWAVGGRWPDSASVILHTSDAGATWFPQTAGTPTVINDIASTDSNHAIAVGYDGTILSTTNSGITWVRRTSWVHEELTAVCFADSQTVLAVGEYLSGLGPPSQILRSTDAGIDWEWIPSTLEGPHDIIFPSPTRGLIANYDPFGCGGAGTIATTNAGSSWTELTLIEYNISRMCFTDTNTGMAVATRCGLRRLDRVIHPRAEEARSGQSLGGGPILRTTDGGLTWIAQIVGNDVGSYFGVSFIDNYTGTVVGPNGTIFHTTNGGVTRIHDGTYQSVNGYILDQNFPNPFNPGTTIRFALPKSSMVRLSLFDILGREISVLVNGWVNAGVHEVQFDGSELSTGAYVCRLEAGNFVQSRKLLLLR